MGRHRWGSRRSTIFKSAHSRQFCSRARLSRPRRPFRAWLGQVGIGCYHASGVKKLSVALDERTFEAAAASAERQGLSLSAWLNRAAENSLAVEDGLAAVAEWEAEHGSFSAEEIAAADAALGTVPKRTPAR